MKAEFSVCPPAVLRGSREYVHSTDLYADLVGALSSREINLTGEFELDRKSVV